MNPREPRGYLPFPFGPPFPLPGCHFRPLARDSFAALPPPLSS